MSDTKKPYRVTDAVGTHGGKATVSTIRETTPLGRPLPKKIEGVRVAGRPFREVSPLPKK